MTDAERQVTALTQNAAQQYPGGMRAVFAAMGTSKSYSTLAGDLSPYSTQGRLKVGDWVRILELTGNLDSLRYVCAHFSGSFMPFSCDAPDLPTLNEEIIQDYPDVVALHTAARAMRQGRETPETVLALMEKACANLRQTVLRAITGDEEKRP